MYMKLQKKDQKILRTRFAIRKKKKLEDLNTAMSRLNEDEEKNKEKKRIKALKSSI